MTKKKIDKKTRCMYNIRNIDPSSFYGKKLVKDNNSKRFINIKCIFPHIKIFYKKENKIYCIFHADNDAVNIETGKRKDEEVDIFIKELKKELIHNNNKDNLRSLTFNTIKFIDPIYFMYDEKTEENVSHKEYKNFINSIIKPSSLSFIKINLFAFGINIYTNDVSEINFNYCHFNNMINFDVKMFTSFTFSNCTFNGEVIAEEVEFTDIAFLANSFRKNVSFHNSFSIIDFIFQDNIFGKKESYISVDFSKKLNSEIKEKEYIYDKVDFSENTVFGSISFENRKLLINLSQTKIYSSFNFSFVKFHPMSNFYNLSFDDIESFGIDNCYRILRYCMKDIEQIEWIEKLKRYEEISNSNIIDELTRVKNVKILKGKRLNELIYEEITSEQKNRDKKIIAAQFIRKLLIQHGIKEKKSTIKEFYRFRSKIENSTKEKKNKELKDS